MGLSKKEAELRSYEVMKLVGIDDEIFYQSPFNLSGGQKRKVAIAGILAMRPEVLILDEPTAGLDPLGQKEIFNLIKKIQKETNLTIILVSHSMEDVANYADKIVVMNHGHVLYNDEPKKVFAHYDELEKIGLKAPFASYLMADLSKKGFDVDTNITTNGEAVSEILHALGR
jgi:energy-coupling factor transport system ATP-binding protein